MAESQLKMLKDLHQEYLEEYEELLNFKDIVIAWGKRHQYGGSVKEAIYWMHHELLEASTA